MKLEMCSSFPRNFYSTEQFRHKLVGSFSGYAAAYNPPKSKVAEHAIKLLEEQYQKDKALHENNIPAIENNKSLVSEIKAFMAEIGIPSTYSEVDKKSRARYPKSYTVQAGYLQDIERNIKRSDGFDESQWTKLREKFTAELQKYQAEELSERNAAERASKEKEEKRKADMILAGFLVKYGLEPLSEWDDVLDAILEKDKYLRLAHAMLETRNDWNDGYYKVENALNGFSADSPQDSEIIDDIQKCLDSAEDGIDGRVFRDTTWSYDRIFGYVDEDLMKDYNVAYEQVSKERW